MSEDRLDIPAPPSSPVDSLPGIPRLRPAWWRGPDWAWILGIAAIVRGIALSGFVMIGADSMHFLAMAGRIEAGAVAEAWAHPLRYHPGYPSLIAAAHVLLAPLGMDLDNAALVVSALAGVVMVLPLYLLARWAYGVDAALLSGLLAALHPELVLLSADVMTETAFFAAQGAAVALLAWGLTTSRLSAWAGAGLCAAAALWIRAEGVYSAALIGAGGVWALVRGRARGFRALLGAAARCGTALGLMAVAFAPYVFWIHGQTGRWFFTNKGSVVSTAASLAGAPVTAAPRPVSLHLMQKAFGRSTVYWAVLPLAVLGVAATARRRAWTPAAVTALAIAGIGCGGQIAGHLLVRYAVSPRYFLQGTVFLLPAAGCGLAALGSWAAATRGMPRGRQLAAAVLGAMAVLSIGRAVSPGRAERIGLREAGEWIRRAYGGGQYLMSCEEQPAHYAAARLHILPYAYDEAEAELTAGPGRFLVLMEKNLKDLEPSFRSRLESGPMQRVAEFARPGLERVWVYRSPVR